MQTLSFIGPWAGSASVHSFPTRKLDPIGEPDIGLSMLAEAVDLSPASAADETFKSEPCCWMFGNVIFVRSRCANTPADPSKRCPISFPNHWRVVLARSNSDQQGSLSLRSEPHGRLSVQSSAMPFEAQEVDVLRALFLPRELWPDELVGLSQAHDLDINPGLGALLAGYMDHLVRVLPQISPDRAQDLAIATRSLVAACIAPCLEHYDSKEAALASLLVNQARRVVRQNMASPDFGPKQLARMMAMSRSKLYRFFESNGGVAHFINRERLHEAHRVLNSPRDPLSIHVIGNEVGFPDHSTFSRAFRREFGYSPREANGKGHLPLLSRAARQNA